MTSYHFSAGVCKHDNIFEGSTDVRRVKFNGNLLALHDRWQGMLGGYDKWRYP